MRNILYNLKENKKTNIIIRFVALIVLGILIQIGATYLLDAILNGFSGLSSVSESYSEVIEKLTSMEPRRIVTVILISPLIEEAVFRKGLIGIGLVFFDQLARLQKKDSVQEDRFSTPADNRTGLQKTMEQMDLNKRFWFINVLQAVLFGLYHGNVVQGVYAFLLGILIGCIYGYAGGYFSCLVLHVSINTAGLYLTPFLPSQYSAGVKALVGITVLTVVVMLTVWIIRRCTEIAHIKMKR